MARVVLLLCSATTAVSALNALGSLRMPQPAHPALSAQRLRTSRQPLMADVEMEDEEIEMSEEEFAEYEEGMEAPVDPSQLSSEARKVYNGMRSETGVEFAPWMKIDPEAIARAKKEREARKAAASADRSATDGIKIDPQAMETGAAFGLSSKTLSEEEVELRWSTNSEIDNAGFIVQRRPGGSERFDDLASFESFAPLRTKGPAGGAYVYLDDTADVGTWVYRIVDCDVRGERSAICQQLVEVESASEQTQQLVVGAAFAALALALVAAGVFIDPIQTTSGGGGGFF